MFPTDLSRRAQVRSNNRPDDLFVTRVLNIFHTLIIITADCLQHLPLAARPSAANSTLK